VIDQLVSTAAGSEYTADPRGTIEKATGTPAVIHPKVAAQNKLVEDALAGLAAHADQPTELGDQARAGIAKIATGAVSPEVRAKAKAMLDLHGPDLDFVALATGMGVPASRATTSEELAEQLRDTSLEVEGHVRVGSNLISLGDAWEGLEHLDRAIELFDPRQHVGGRFRLGASHGVVPHTTSAFALWSLGYPDRAVEHGAHALHVAEEIGHPFTSAYALFHVALLDLWRGDWERVNERAPVICTTVEMAPPSGTLDGWGSASATKRTSSRANASGGEG